MMRALSFSLLCCSWFLIGLAACTRSPEGTSFQPQPSPIQMNVQPDIVNNDSAAFTGFSASNQNSNPLKQIPMDENAQLARSMLGSKGGPLLVVAEDFGGGRGLSVADVDEFTRESLETARKAIDELQKGSLSSDVYSEDAQALLRPDLQEISSALSRLSVARFLSIHVSDSEIASFRVHLIGQDLSAFAQISLRNQSKWIVVDLQVDINALSNMTAPDYNSYTPQDGERRMIREGNAGTWP